MTVNDLILPVFIDQGAKPAAGSAVDAGVFRLSVDIFAS